LRRLSGLFAVCALAAFFVTGCSKSSSSESANASASGPVTDVDSSGLKPTAAPALALGDPKHGEAIFTQNCASCHGTAGAGGGIGPVLKGEKQRKDYPAAIAWIKNPQPPMPKLFPSPLSQSDVQDVASYVESL
jgi:mono/diheme cytochrome c family protein